MNNSFTRGLLDLYVARNLFYLTKEQIVEFIISFV